MDLRAEQRKEELESETKKLEGIKEMIVETIEKTKRIEAEYLEEKNKFTKNMLNLRNLEESQELRRNKLELDINLIDQRQVDLGAAEDANAKLKAELEELNSCFPDYDRQLEKLEQEIKEAYMEWESYKENQVMIELGMDFVKGEDRPPHLNAFVQQRWETIKVRQQELNKELAKIDKEISAVEGEVLAKHVYLKELKDQEAALLQKYTAIKEHSFV